MATMVTELYVALKSAGATEDQATKAAKAVAAYDNCFNRIEADLLVLKWMVGAILASVASLALRTFF